MSNIKPSVSETVVLLPTQTIEWENKQGLTIPSGWTEWPAGNKMFMQCGGSV